MVEPEMAFCDLEQLMEMEEEFVSYIVQRCLKVLRRRACRAGTSAMKWRTRPRPSAHPLRDESTLAINWCCRGGRTRARLSRPWCCPSSGATISAACTRPVPPPSSTSPLSSTITRRSRPLHGANGRSACCSADLLARRLRRDHRRQRADERTELFPRHRPHKLPRECTNGGLDLRRYGSAVHSGLAKAWSAPSPGSAAWSMCAKPSPSRARWAIYGREAG